MTDTVNETDPETTVPEPETETVPDTGEQDDAAEQEETPEPGADFGVEPDQPALSEKELDQLTKKLENEARRHASRVSEIMGEDALALVKCEACDETIPGFHWPADVFPDGSAERTLYELLAGGTDAQMRHPDYFKTCPTCNGYGQVLTGARTDMTRTIMCPDCDLGCGYIDTRRTQTTALVTAVSDALASEKPSLPPAPETDWSGRPPGHPRYGKNNFFLTPDEWDQDHAAGFDVGERPSS